MESALQDRVVLVTGGSSGIGRAVATAFGRERARVVVTYRTDSAGAASCAREIEAAGGTAVTAAFELTAEDSASELVGSVAARWGGIDVLVNCAGGRDRTAPWGSRFEDTAAPVWRGMLDADLSGPYRLLQAAVPAMRGRGWGRIVLVSSGAGEKGGERAADYGNAKANLIVMQLSLGSQLS